MLVTSCAGALVLVALITAYRARRLLLLTLAAVAVGLLVHPDTTALLTHILTRL